MRVLIDKDPFSHRTADVSISDRFCWPCSWIECGPAGEPPFVTAFRRCFTLDAARKVRIHVSADERYELFLDGERVGRGSERGDVNNWFFETYEFEISAGDHTFAARVWTLDEEPLHETDKPSPYVGSSRIGSIAPCAQITSRAGFILAPEDDDLTSVLGTGSSAWETRLLNGFSFELASLGAQLAGAHVRLDGSEYEWDWLSSEDGWRPATTGYPGVDGVLSNDRRVHHRLKPAILPAMISREIAGMRVVHVDTPDEDPAGIQVLNANTDADLSEAWQVLLGGEDLVIPANTSQRAIIDLNEYYCAYSGVTVSGGAGASVRLHWAEALLEEPGTYRKGVRDRIEGKYFGGMGDTFLPDGGDDREFTPLWWHAGRYLEVFVTTADQELTLHSIGLKETRYPLENEGGFEADDDQLREEAPFGSIIPFWRSK